MKTDKALNGGLIFLVVSGLFFKTNKKILKNLYIMKQNNINKDKLYDYGDYLMEINQSFRVPKTGWHKIENGEIPSKNQQKQLKLLGWGECEDLTFNGAEAIIQEILESAFDCECPTIKRQTFLPFDKL